MGKFSITKQQGLLVVVTISTILAIGAVIFAVQIATSNRYYSKACMDNPVIVIGAGISGLTAAASLKLSGCQVVILESRDVPGGRIYRTSAPNDIPKKNVWLYYENVTTVIRNSTVQNPISILALTLNITTKSGDIPITNQTYPANGSFTADDVTFYLPKSPSNISNLLPVSSVVPTGIVYRDFWLKSLFDTVYGFTADQFGLSAFPWNYGFTPITGGDTFIIDGFDTLIDGIVNKMFGAYRTLTTLSITYSSPVTSISTDSDFVTVTTKSGTSYRGVAVIVTVPLGVLKSNTITFNPPLPNATLAAMNALNTSILDTLWLNYSQSGDPLRQIVRLQRTDFPGDETAWPFLMRTGFSSSSNIIELRFGGPYAAGMEMNSTDNLVSTAFNITNAAFSISNQAVIQGQQKTNFATDPNFLGSFVATPPTTTLQLLDTLAMNYSKTIFFAGEHTVSTAPATVHGAIVSGIKAAQDVLNMPAQFDQVYYQYITPIQLININLADWYSQDLIAYTNNIQL